LTNGVAEHLPLQGLGARDRLMVGTDSPQTGRSEIGGERHSSPTFIRHDVYMGSANDKPRKRRHHLPKVPKYEEPNTLPLPGLTGNGGSGDTSGRFGHGSDGKEHHPPGSAGRALLRMLGMRRKDPEIDEPVTGEHKD